METKKQNIDFDNMEASFKEDVDVMVMCYDNGWTDRGEDDKRKFDLRLKANIDHTISYSKEVVSYFKKLSLSVNGVFVKVERANSLSVIITVPVETFVKEELLNVYSFTHDIEKHSRSDEYRVSFSITYDDGNLDESALLSDGFYRVMKAKNE